MILEGDALHKLKDLKDNSVDQLVTDPPYGIEFMGKDWDQALPSVDIWKEAYRVMKPGSFGFVMCIPRQDCLSRMMISLENAGFNINFSSIYWTYATGFPKALNMGKAIDKRLGKEREVIGYGKRNREDKKSYGGNDVKSTFTSKGSSLKDLELTSPSSEEVKNMEGSYGGFQPKPAVECIIVVMVPLSEGSYINQAMKDGKGVVNFDDCRIPYKDEQELNKVNEMAENIKKYKPNNDSGCDIKQLSFDRNWNPTSNGRFPANLLISDDILDTGKYDKGGTPSINKEVIREPEGNPFDSVWGKELEGVMRTYGDSGGFSRFFSLDAWAEKNLPFLIVPKASKKEKNTGCEESNSHPTVKPMKLMSYLITLGSRPGDTIIDPFGGSGTTGCAAVMLGRKFIIIEKEAEYIPIIKARIKYYKTLPLKI